MVTIDLLYDALTVFPSGVAEGEASAVPDVASSVTPNADSTVWTVTLADRTFSDGSPITAGDVKASYERLAKKGSASLAGVRLEIINGYAEVASGAAAEMSGLQVVDAKTLTITLREPYVQLRELLASPLYGIVPKASADRGDAAFTEPVSSGPYVFADHDDTRTRLERSSSSAGAGAGPNAVDVVGYASWDDAYGAFERGDVDWSLVPADRLADADTSQFVVFGSELWMGFNLADPTYSDARFRQAIVQAVDSDKVVADALPGRSALRSIVPQGVPGFDADACANLCEYSPDVARAWLTEAFPDGAIPTVTLDGYDDPTQVAMLNSIQAQLAAVGIPAQVRTRPFADYRSFATSGQTGVFAFGWVGLVPTQDAYLAPLFRSTSADNVTGFKSADIDAQIAAARANNDAAARQSAYAWIERQVLNQSVLVPLAQLRTNQVVAGRVHGWSTRLDGTYVVPGVWVTD
jgi:ABC-type transport system substrate-binding protein